MHTQWALQGHFNIGHQELVPTQNATPLQVENFKPTGSVLKRKSPGSERTLQALENTEAIGHPHENGPCSLAHR